jgi:hypothetical protein
MPPKPALRNFTISASEAEHEADTGVYSGRAPATAAAKACRRIFDDLAHDAKFSRHRHTTAVKFIIRERGTDKDYAFEGTKRELHPHKTVSIKGKSVTYTHEYKVKRLFKNTRR